jgi:hypothetical protein
LGSLNPEPYLPKKNLRLKGKVIMLVKISPLALTLLTSMNLLFQGVTFSVSLPISSGYPEAPRGDVNLPVCYMQTQDGRVLNLENICGKKLEDSSPASSVEVPDSTPTRVPDPTPTGVPYVAPTP